MSSRLYLISIAAAALALGHISTEAMSQTYRISAGTTPSGAKCYMEVFEYDYVQDKPTFPGGDNKFIEFVNANRHYPQEAYRKGIQGRVTCSFVVNVDGSVSHIQVIRSVAGPLNEEAVRVLKLMPAWRPGRINGQAVPVRVIRSVPFRK